MRSMYKYELARLAGVSRRTFGRWLKCHETELAAFGYRPKSQLLSPAAVNYLSKILCIDIP